MQDRYEAYARVYVDTHSMLRPLLSGLAVQPDVEQMVTMMGRTLVSRLNVEKVIEVAIVDVGLDTPHDREQLIARVTKDLTIRPGRIETSNVAGLLLNKMEGPGLGYLHGGYGYGAK